jgi:hypothetical protein
MSISPDPHVKPDVPVLERGDTVTDEDGSQWRVLVVDSLGIHRVRVGSLAEQVIFGDEG